MSVCLSDCLSARGGTRVAPKSLVPLDASPGRKMSHCPAGVGGERAAERRLLGKTAFWRNSERSERPAPKSTKYIKKRKEQLNPEKKHLNLPNIRNPQGPLGAW